MPTEWNKGRCLGLAICFGLMVNAGASSAQNTKTSASLTGAKSETTEKGAKAKRHEDENIEVESVTFAVGISSKVPVGASDSFDSSVGGLYFWSRLRVHESPTQIKYIWYRDDKMVSESTVNVRFKHTRLWTYRSVKPGLWRVEIADSEGKPVTEATCIVRSPSKTPDKLQPSAQ